ncbi:hypothetical protein ANO11243_091200 [Dothideomycetidae sp. 11243]|nr:hypothetical protein ANO11243_091200 [fungal sp. No.11243]
MPLFGRLWSEALLGCNVEGIFFVQEHVRTIYKDWPRFWPVGTDCDQSRPSSDGRSRRSLPDAVLRELGRKQGAKLDYLSSDTLHTFVVLIFVLLLGQYALEDPWTVASSSPAAQKMF